MSVKGSKTEQNLKDAFARECMANLRYLYFAAKADVEGYNDVSAVFRSAAKGETAHAHGHLEYLQEVGDPATGLPFGSTSANLAAAIAGETYEYTDMYPDMAKVAREETSRKSPTVSKRSPKPSAHTPNASRNPRKHPQPNRRADRRPQIPTHDETGEQDQGKPAGACRPSRRRRPPVNTG